MIGMIGGIEREKERERKGMIGRGIGDLRYIIHLIGQYDMIQYDNIIIHE